MSGGEPMVRVRLPAVLRGLAQGRPEVRVEGRTVGEVLRALDQLHPGLAAQVLDGGGRIRRYLTLFLGDEDVRHLGGLDAPVRDGDELTIVPAVAGGAPCR